MSRIWILIVLLAGCPRGEEASSQPSASAPVSVAASATPPPSASAKVAERPFYYERPITDADLKGRTLREFSLMRNTIYARAGNKFRKPWLHAYFSAQPWYQPRDVMDESKITALDRQNARKIVEADAALTKKELERRRDGVTAKKERSPEDTIELALLSQRLGVWLGGDVANASPLEDPARLDKLLTVEELSTLSRRDLRMLRNMIYARHGRAFDSAVVREYFKDAAWYKPNDSFHEGMLTGIDHKNIRIISSIEDSLGGPMHENPDYGKDGWFVMA